jgi:hypothetical protein
VMEMEISVSGCSSRTIHGLPLARHLLGIKGSSCDAFQPRRLDE